MALDYSNGCVNFRDVGELVNLITSKDLLRKADCSAEGNLLLSLHVKKYFLRRPLLIFGKVRIQRHLVQEISGSLFPTIMKF
jgi:hypothetical protein